MPEKNKKVQKEKQEFLVVYEDIWNNKESIRTDQIGDAIKLRINTRK